MKTHFLFSLWISFADLPHVRFWQSLASTGLSFLSRPFLSLSNSHGSVFISLAFFLLFNQQKQGWTKSGCLPFLAVWTPSYPPLRLLGPTPVGFPSGPPCLPLMTSGLYISWLRLLSVGQTTSLTKPHLFIGGRTKPVHTAESIPLITQFHFHYFTQAHQR